MSERMMLELAEGIPSKRQHYLNDEPMFYYYLVPDIYNEHPPAYVREDVVWNLDDEEFNEWLQIVSPLNSDEYLQKLIDRRNTATQQLGDFFDDIGGFISTAVGVASNAVVPGAGGAVSGIIGGLIGGGNSGSSQPPVIQNSTTDGMSLFSVPGTSLLVGYNPTNGQLIAFSSLQSLATIFPNSGGSHPPLPPGVNLNLAVTHPDQIVNTHSVNESSGQGEPTSIGIFDGRQFGISNKIMIPLEIVGGYLIGKKLKFF